MAEFVVCLLNRTQENDEVKESVVEPIAKKKRGAAAKYDEYKGIDSYEEVQAIMKPLGLQLKEDKKNGNSFFHCKKPLCDYKGKAAYNDLKFSIFTTSGGHNHAPNERKNGMAKKIKEIVDSRVVKNESTNPEAVLQVLLNQHISLPTTLQVRNHVAYSKRKLFPDGKLNM